MTDDAGFWNLESLETQRVGQGGPYLEFLRTTSLSAGLYVLPAGAADAQTPHHEDELYYVARGKARMRIGDTDQAIGPGSVIFVAAEAQHRFHAIEEELTVVVFFAPPEAV